jgi:hypothetical protein
MITLQEHTGFIKVEEYSLAGWLAEVETVIKQGYTFDFESNETHPQAFGNLYTVVMVPTSVPQEDIDLEPLSNLTSPIEAFTATTEPLAPAKVDGRKKK